VFVCKEIAKLPIVAFGVISNKNSLGNYAITEHWKYYNKNCQYLLEIVGGFVRNSGSSKLSEHSIVFENKNSAEYGKLINFISTIKSDPKSHRESKNLAYIQEGSITHKNKSEEPLLAIADCIASALYQTCSYINEYGLTENRYLRELKNIFHYGSITKNIVNNGIKLVHDLKDLRLLEEDYNFLAKLKHDKT
jgi:hypothetical protein